ncbi:transposon Ty3-I Gag-Pol polyprotein [Trichonephila clavipes]|nr:transposon Ty3-I Gag-Pol polyprotein [Trichonephila clavipes]
MSKKTSIQEEKLCSYELEVLAVIEVLKKFRNYLLGRKFRIQTDCAAFAKTLGKKELRPKMARWSIFLTDFNYEVVHRPAKQMQHVDALSRHPVMLVTSDELTCKIVNAHESDEYIRTIKKLLCARRRLFKPYIPKEDLPLSTYHVDFIGPLPTTNKNYNHIFTVIDAFTKFTWFYPTKSTTAQEAIERLKLQQKTFGNSSRVINDKGGAFRSKEFEDYCADEQISNVQITTGVPRGN